MVAVLFVGGPKDGEVHEIQTMSNSTLPPEEIALASTVSYEVMAKIARGEDVPDEKMPVTYFTYVRKVSPLDDGPVWMYVPKDEHWRDPLDEYQAHDEPTLTMNDFWREEMER